MGHRSLFSPVWGVVSLGLLTLSGATGAQVPPMGPTASSASVPNLGGYLVGHEPDTVIIIPHAPMPGSPQDLADRQIFRATRALKDTPRWTLAQNDAALAVPALLKDFSCATGATLTPETAPTLIRMLRRMAPDLASAYGRPKDLYKRPRPFMRDEGEICLPRTPDLTHSFDYPSGHATFAWTFGLILAELEPDRAGPILARARAFGESRAVCGVHSASAITEARTAASALFASLQSSPAFQSDLAEARQELAALRTAGGDSQVPDGPQCKAEATLIAQTPW